MSLENIKDYLNNFNTTVTSDDYYKIINIIECGLVLKEGGFYQTSQPLVDKTEIAKNLKLVLDFGFFHEDNQPLSFCFVCDNMIGFKIEELIFDKKLKPEFQNIYERMSGNEEWLVENIVISKINNEYILKSIKEFNEKCDENLIKIDENQFIDFIEMFSFLILNI